MASTSAPRPIWIPATVSQGGRRGWTAAAVLGAIAAGPSLVIPALLPATTAFGLLAVWLGATGAVYLGFALSDGRQSALRNEALGLFLFVGLAATALALDSAWLLGAGYLGHGLWDVIHHGRRHGVDTAMPWWWVPACLGYDAVIAIYVVWRF